MQLIKEPIILAQHVWIWKEVVTYCCVFYTLKIGSVAVLHQQTYLAYFNDWLQYKPYFGLFFPDSAQQQQEDANILYKLSYSLQGS